MEDGNAEKGNLGVVNARNEGKVEEKTTSSARDVWNALVWHGGSVFDAWLNAVAAQVGSLILTLPYTFAQMGYWFGVGSQFLYGAFGCWTVYLLSLFHAEASQRTRATGTIHERHVLQYHEVISIVAGKKLGNLVLAFNMTALTFACVLQLIACSSHVYYMNSNWNKREWLYLFGTLAIPTVLLPSVHNFRIISLLGIATTSITSAYMTVAAVQHGQIGQVTHQGPQNLVDFFTGATNILFSFGSHGLCIELMEAMWKPRRYKFAYIFAVMYTYLLTVPNSVSVYWAYGDILLHRSNAFGVLPPSKMKNVCIISMILHQYVAFLLNANPLFLAWEKLVGVHLSNIFLLRALARVPVVLVIWFFALAIPFFGPINSIMGAFLISFSVYIIPSVAFMRAYSKKQLETAQDDIAKRGRLMYWTSAFVATWVFVFGFGFGGWASGTNFIRQIRSFGFFEKCYQCPPKR
ncbi:auxin transporter-like protein 1 [Magnolia sinica]|uniref:auxin transporter-like protein 1 n=1 Tax=Magnolia sinica TaxID=86752 RepID=UPI0026596890|nr:auxin transporter-like protein 1 [Magnolia sinica]